MRQTSIVQLTPQEARILSDARLLSQRGWPDAITYKGVRCTLHQFITDADDGALQAARYRDIETGLVVEVAD